jgi:hypothetical protein
MTVITIGVPESTRHKHAQGHTKQTKCWSAFNYHKFISGARWLIRLMNLNFWGMWGMWYEEETCNVDSMNLAHPPWQCTSSHNIVDSRALGKIFNSRLSKTSLFSWPIHSRNFYSKIYKVALEGRRFQMTEDIIRNMTVNWVWFNRHPSNSPSKGRNAMGAVCCSSKKLFWSG